MTKSPFLFLPGTFCLPESPRYLSFSLGLSEFKKKSLNFLSITATILRKRERKTKSLNFLYKAATTLRKKRRNYRRGKSHNIESCAVSPRSSITIQFCAQQHEQTYFNIQNQYFRFCKVQIFGELVLRFLFSLAV